jgi:2-polyprenyl-6-methoxyphenol hydroxylase-like FAD-dependent oxidoreductase
MDVLWMQISRRADDPGQTFGHVDSGRFFIAINRDEYWQCGLVIPKGSFDEMRARGLPALREEIAKLSPYLRDRIGELRDWKDISLLTVTVDRLTRWFLPGLLCIGDAAHAMSPVGGVGINLAIQDAVAAANMLGVKLMRGGPTEEDLRAFEKRRIFPTRATQRLQVAIQNRVIRRVLAASKPLTLLWPLKLLKRWPYLRRFPARLIGMGFRPEHVKTSETKTA